jgi:hypothetical protein
MRVMAKGKWAQGIVPRNFSWVIKDQLAVCERPGGYGANHRRVRRQEEIIWIRESGFNYVVSLIPAPHNLHNYDELDMPWLHRPYAKEDDEALFLSKFYPEVRELLTKGNKLLVHGEELGDFVSGLMAGYLLWAGLVPTGPKAISITERILERQLGPAARELVALAARLPGPDVLKPPAHLGVPEPAVADVANSDDGGE